MLKRMDGENNDVSTSLRRFGEGAGSGCFG